MAIPYKFIWIYCIYSVFHWLTLPSPPLIATTYSKAMYALLPIF